jgi:hypothetical protein
MSHRADACLRSVRDRTYGNPRPALDRYRQHLTTVVIRVLTNEIDAPGRRADQRRLTAKRATEKLARVVGCDDSFTFGGCARRIAA